VHARTQARPHTHICLYMNPPIQSLPWALDGHSGDQKIHRIHRNLSLYPILKQFNPLHKQLTLDCRFLNRKLILADLEKKFQAFYGNRISFIVFTRSVHWTFRISSLLLA